MTEIKVQLSEMLACRERRAHLQQEYIQLYHCPVISYTMNIPGPVKTTKKIRKVFDAGKNILLNHLKLEQVRIFQMQEFHEVTGDELILAVHYPAHKLKSIAVQIEESYPWGRLLDIDVIDMSGDKLSRSVCRKCLICNQQAHECARSRTHSLKEMQDAVESLLDI